MLVRDKGSIFAPPVDREAADCLFYDRRIFRMVEARVFFLCVFLRDRLVEIVAALRRDRKHGAVGALCDKTVFSNRHVVVLRKDRVVLGNDIPLFARDTRRLLLGWAIVRRPKPRPQHPFFEVQDDLAERFRQRT